MSERLHCLDTPGIELVRIQGDAPPLRRKNSSFTAGSAPRGALSSTSSSQFEGVDLFVVIKWQAHVSKSTIVAVPPGKPGCIEISI